MTEPRPSDAQDLRRGWTTGACATAAVKAALMRLWGGVFPPEVQITLPRGETPTFPLAHQNARDDWAEAGITKDAGDDPDVTHGALVISRVRLSPGGVVFRAGKGVGQVTKPGLPIAVGEPSINPVPRQMMEAVVSEMATHYARAPDVEITISIPGGEELAKKTWNPRLGIAGGLSILGTTGIVRPFSCAAWIASIHRGIDVARADGLTHVAGCTGATSERVVQDMFQLPDHAMLDMGDFAGGLLKYLAKAPARNPIRSITLGGGIGKMTKMAQGARDLHSSRSQVDFEALAKRHGVDAVRHMNTALEVYGALGAPFAEDTARAARDQAALMLSGCDTSVHVVVIDRGGTVLAQA